MNWKGGSSSEVDELAADHSSTSSDAKRDRRSESDIPASGSTTKFRWDGGGVVLGETDHLAFTDDEFPSAVADCLRDQRTRSAQALVRRFPDLALIALSSEAIDRERAMALEQIANVVDASWGDPNLPLCRAYMNCDEPQRTRWLKTRAEFIALLEQGRPADALALRLDHAQPRPAPDFVQIECGRLKAIAHLMADQDDDAARELTLAVKRADQTSPYLASHLRLLLGEVYRHSRQLHEWRQTWAEAVTGHALLLADRGLADPMFWTRAAYLQPANVDWPVDALGPHRDFLIDRGILSRTNPAASVNAEGLIWSTIGAMHLDRGEGQNAVLALKKAEAMVDDPATQSELQLHEARALIASGQPGAASAIVIRLIGESKDPLLRDRAQAILGALKLDNGAVSQGLTLLNQSLKSSSSWPLRDRLRAQADYSLALLIAGKESEAIPVLDNVQREFESCEEFEQAYQCLWNMVTYFDKTSQPAKHAAALKALEAFDSQSIVR